MKKEIPATFPPGQDEGEILTKSPRRHLRNSHSIATEQNHHGITLRKLSFIALLAFFCAPMGFCEEKPKFDSLSTLDGKSYSAVTVSKVEPDGILIAHSGGMRKIWFHLLAPELQEQFGYDPAAAEKYRIEQENIMNAQNAARAEQLRVAAGKRAEAAKQEADAAFLANVEKLAKKVQINAFQNSDIGLIGTVMVARLVPEPIKSTLGSVTGERLVWAYRDGGGDGVISGVKEFRIVNVTDNTGLTRINLGQSIQWEGKAWRIGTIQYKTRQGLQRSCGYFTASENTAVKFYRQHGFPPASDGIVTRK